MPLASELQVPLALLVRMGPMALLALLVLLGPMALLAYKAPLVFKDQLVRPAYQVLRAQQE